jgi:hypothetical protein
MSKEVVGTAKARLSELLRERHGRLGHPLDMEPWEVLVELIRSRRHPTVGGPPQLAKVYPYMDTQLLAVKWPSADGKLTLGGRTLLDYEKTDAQVISPDGPFVGGDMEFESEAPADSGN